MPCAHRLHPPRTTRPGCRSHRSTTHRRSLSQGRESHRHVLIERVDSPSMVPHSLDPRYAKISLPVTNTIGKEFAGRPVVFLADLTFETRSCIAFHAPSKYDV